MSIIQCCATEISLRLVSDCVCSGYTVTYECVTMGPGSTIFILGSSQECEIDLRHTQFTNDAAFGRCMDGVVIGRGITTDGTLYTSHLNISVISGVIGKTIRCDHYNGISQEVVGSTTLTLTTNIGE